MRIQHSDAPLSRDELGRIAYAAFREHANAKAEDEMGIPGGYPDWDTLPETCREANRKAAQAVRDALIVDSYDLRQHRLSPSCRCPACLDFASRH